MAVKKTKNKPKTEVKIKETKINSVVSSISNINNRDIKIPLVGVIVFCLLLAASSFFAGIAWQ